MQTSTEFKHQVVAALIDQRSLFGGADAAFAKKYGINPTSFSTIKNGSVEGGILKETKWLDLARQLGVDPEARAWKMARTEVFEAIENDILFCKDNSKSLLLVDEPEIGKTVTGKYLSKSISNCFYLDCTQAKTRSLFVKAFAQALGADTRGKHNDIKADIKATLRTLSKPVVILDEAGDLEYSTFLLLKEFWNATDGVCGWYMMGADGLRTKFERGISNKKVGFREIFSRYNGRYMSIVPTDRNERKEFYRKLITDVLKHNAPNPARIPALVTKCLSSDASGEIGGLRRADTLVLLEQ